MLTCIPYMFMEVNGVSMQNVHISASFASCLALVKMVWFSLAAYGVSLALDLMPTENAVVSEFKGQARRGGSSS